MPVITMIQAQKRPGRYNLYLDGAFAFGISESTLIQFRLAKDQQLEDSQVHAIQVAEIDATANTTALNYLSHQPRTKKELQTKLATEGFGPEVITPVLRRLTELGYLDDAAYAGMVVRDNLTLGDRGPTGVMAKLKAKGVDANVIADALAEVSASQWQELGLRVAQKAAKQNAKRAYKDQLQRIQLALCQKGFTGDQVPLIMADLALEPDVEAEQDQLLMAATKQWRQKRRYEGYERRQRVKQALFRQGFELDAIDAVITQLEADSV